MSVVLVFVVSFAALVLAPPAFLAFVLRAIAAPGSMREEECRDAGRPLILALRGPGALLPAPAISRPSPRQ